jgi:hypothetical protein
MTNIHTNPLVALLIVRPRQCYTLALSSPDFALSNLVLSDLALSILGLADDLALARSHPRYARPRALDRNKLLTNLHKRLPNFFPTQQILHILHNNPLIIHHTIWTIR